MPFFGVREALFRPGQEKSCCNMLRNVSCSQNFWLFTVGFSRPGSITHTKYIIFAIICFRRTHYACLGGGAYMSIEARGGEVVLCVHGINIVVVVL